MYGIFSKEVSSKDVEYRFLAEP
ncbi:MULTISPECIES: DUF2627 domain-containing protein [unclassified Erwinia]|nr:DUF2627 domain-containing protein [Erwinia sp. ErVv1]